MGNDSNTSPGFQVERRGPRHFIVADAITGLATHWMPYPSQGSAALQRDALAHAAAVQAGLALSLTGATPAPDCSATEDHDPIADAAALRIFAARLNVIEDDLASQATAGQGRLSTDTQQRLLALATQLQHAAAEFDQRAEEISPTPIRTLAQLDLGKTVPVAGDLGQEARI